MRRVVKCVYKEDIERMSSPNWDGQPAPADRCSCQWKSILKG